MPAAGKILVVRGGAIGDFILTFPVFAALRAQFPGARISALAYPKVAKLALAGGLVDEVEPIESRSLAGFFARGGNLDPRLSEYFGSCAIIVSYLYDPDGIFAENVGRVSRAQFLQGIHRPDDSARVPASRSLLKVLERIAIFDSDPVPRLALQAAAARTRRIAIHPGSGSEQKNWPVRNWIELVQRLMGETSVPLLIVGGEAEQGRLSDLRKLPAGDRMEFAINLPLEQLGMKLQECAGFVGHDSGITHLAGALGLPGIVLWGPSVETVWRPPSDKMQLLSGAAGLASLSSSRVFDELKSRFGL